MANRQRRGRKGLTILLVLWGALAVCPHATGEELPEAATVPPLQLALPEPVESDLEPQQVHAMVVAALREQFDQRLQQPDRYRDQALRECDVFPEGRIYPFAVPALAYANLALTGDLPRAEAAAQMRKLIDLALVTTIDKVRPARGELTQLVDYQKQGTYLATVNLTLAAYALISDDGRYDVLHTHLSDLLYKALSELDGAPLASYPEYTWYFDTMMALLSLHMYDRTHELSRAEPLVDQHLAWLAAHGTDAETNLPIAYEGGLPRGCDVSMQVCLWQQMRPPVAKQMYGRFVRHYWSDFGVLAGFREWPHSQGYIRTGDVDSGPLLMGIGPTASGVGIGAARAVGDSRRWNRLVLQLQIMPGLLKAIEQSEQAPFGEGVPVTDRYVTGFLYGDVVLFYAVTWTPYPDAARSELADRP